LAQLYCHIVFATKHRHPYLEDPSLRHQTYAFLATVSRELRCPNISIGGVEDHVHILCRLSRSMSVAELVRELKRKSSKWLKTKGSHLQNFYWQEGYGAFSVSPSHLKSLTAYITNQEEHHRQESFDTEYRRLLDKYGMEYNERDLLK
jgi:REP element-mobilizing transposase RayT